MKTKTTILIVDNIRVEVVHKRIKNIYLTIHLPEGSVRLSVPAGTGDDFVRNLIINKLEYIREKQHRCQTLKAFTPQTLVNGAYHDFLGKPYCLKMTEFNGPVKIWIREEGILEMRVRPGTDMKKRVRILDAWYREQLEQILPGLIAKWEQVMGVSVHEWRIKKMKTRWGSCNIKAKRIWINLNLAKESLEYLEYIIVHELTHLLERGHNIRFRQLMDSFMPNWRTYDNYLNK